MKNATWYKYDLNDRQYDLDPRTKHEYRYTYDRGRVWVACNLYNRKFLEVIWTEGSGRGIDGWPNLPDDDSSIQDWEGSYPPDGPNSLDNSPQEVPGIPEVHVEPGSSSDESPTPSHRGQERKYRGPRDRYVTLSCPDKEPAGRIRS